MNYKKVTILVALIFLGLGGLHAQKNLTSGGGEAKGSGGIVSYSIGQAVYTTNNGNVGSMAQGVQQTFDTDAIDELIEIEMSIYPNPTTNYLTLEVENPEMLSYRLFDLRGKLLASKKISTASTTIEMERLPEAPYILKVIYNKKAVKTFRVVKH